MEGTSAVVRVAFAALLAGAPGSAFAHDVGVGLLRVSDGKVAREPKKDFLFVCQMTLGGGGADRPGPWSVEGLWKPDNKPNVRGAVEWPAASINVTVEGAQRVIASNGLPTHKTGVFPIDKADPVYKYDRNPNAIAEQTVALRLPALPRAASRPACVPMGMVGVALTGAAIFNAIDARGRDAPAWEMQDSCGGHVEQGGVYHYHDYSPCMSDLSGRGGRHSDIVGYALDGFGIFGNRGEGGRRLRNADLDACHGHVHEIIWDGKPQRLYHYHFTDEYPYSIGCFMGEPVPAPRPVPAGAPRPATPPPAIAPAPNAPPPLRGVR